MFLSFVLRLLAGSVAPLFVFSVMEMSQFGLIALTFPRFEERATWSMRAVDGLRALVQAYIWFGWAAYCVALAIRYANNPLATQEPWVFYLTAALGANIPIVYLAMKERGTAGSDEEKHRLRTGTNLCRAITMVGFFLFAVSPGLMATPYGWLVGSQQSLEAHASVEEVLAAAEQGVPEAQHMLSEGRGVSPDATRAVRWWRAAAEQHHLASQSRLCGVYLEGPGVPPSDTDAVHWCTAAANQGDPRASLNLGTLYSQGRGVSQDESEADRWYAAAAEGGVPAAQAILGFKFAGAGAGPADLVQAYRWLSLAASRLPFGQELTDVTHVRDDVRQRLTAEQLSEAVQLVLETQPVSAQ